MSNTKLDGRKLAMALRVAYLSMHREADAVFKDFGITANQFVVLSVLAKEEMTQNALAEQIASDRNTIRPILLTLEKQKLIRRRPHESDGRALVVEITARGMKKFNQVQDADAAFLQRLSSGFTSIDFERLVEQLGHLQQAMTPAEQPG